MIPPSEWKFFEGTEQRLKHLARHRAENLIARWTGALLPWDPAEIASRQAAILQELDYPARVESALATDPTPAEARHLELHRRAALQAVFDTHPDLFPIVHDLETRWAAFKPELNGAVTTWAETTRLIRDHPDRDVRESAWKAVAPFARAVQEDTAELVRRRELLARALLGEGFPVVAFHFGEMDRSKEVGLLDMLERYTRKAYEEAKSEIQRKLDLHDLDPWDMEFGLTRLGELPAAGIDPLAAARQQAQVWGFSDPSLPTAIRTPDLPWESRAVWVDVPGDVRVLYRPGSGWNHTRAVFRAFGAALHGAHAGSKRHFLEQDSPAMIEASARLFEGVLDDPDWLAAHTGATPDAISAHLRLQRISRILELRQHAALTAFENLVYAASNLDPQRLFGEVLEQMLQETRRPDAVWTSHVDLVLRPAASGAAIVGALLAAQMRRRLQQDVADPWNSPQTGDRLREHLMEPGARLSLDEKILHATGAPLDLDSLAHELGVEFHGPSLDESEGVSDEAAADYFRDIDLES